MNYKEQITQIFNQYEIDLKSEGDFSKTIYDTIEGLSIGDRGVLYDMILEKYGEPKEYSSFFIRFNINGKDLYIDGMPDRGDYVRKISTDDEQIDLNDFDKIESVLEKIEKMVNSKKTSPSVNFIEEIEKLMKEKRTRMEERIAYYDALERKDFDNLQNNLETIGVDLNRMSEINDNLND